MSGEYVAQVSNTAMGRDHPKLGAAENCFNTAAGGRAVHSQKCRLRFLFRSPSNSASVPIPSGRPTLSYRRLVVLVSLLLVGAAVRRAQPVSAGDEWQPISRSEEHTSELQSPDHLVCRLLLEKKK